MLTIRETVETVEGLLPCDLIGPGSITAFRALIRWYHHGFFFRRSENGTVLMIGLLPTIEGFAKPGGEWEISRNREPDIWTTKMEALEFVSNFTELMPPARAVIVWACPWLDEKGELEEVRRRARESIEFWIAKKVLNQDVLLACKKTCMDRFQKVGASLEAITGDLVITMEESLKLVENAPVGLPKATQTRVLFSHDLKEIEMRYPDGRVSRHCFFTWPDGETRCDCEWKRYNWGSLCKHELLRDEEKAKRETNENL